MAVEGWEEAALSDLGEVITGKTPSTQNQIFWSGNIPFVTPTDMDGRKFISSTERSVTEEALRNIKKPLPRGSVMVTCIASIGKMAISDQLCITNQQINSVVPDAKINSEFLYYSLLTKVPELEALSGKTAVPIINKSQFSKIRIQYPSLQEQKKIAEVLESVDEAIAKTEAVIAQTERVKQGLLQQLLTRGIGHTRFKQTDLGEIPESWEIYRIEDVLLRLIDYRGVPPPKANKGVPLITAKNVRFGYLNPEPREYISEDDYKGWMRRGIPNEGDVIFTTEAPLGYVAQIPGYKIALGQRTLTLCPNPKIVSQDFLKWRLLSPSTQAIIHEHATGSTAKGIKQRTFRKLFIAVPSLKEQVTICDSLNSIELSLNGAIATLDTFKKLKRSLMSDLLTGRVRVSIRSPKIAEAA